MRMRVAYDEADCSGDRVPDRVEGVYALRGEASGQYRFHAREGVEPDTKQSACGSERSFKCDGRTHCSQMTSCAEATYFLKNCPGVKMDGNNDGVPCEQQWCR